MKIYRDETFFDKAYSFYWNIFWETWYNIRQEQNSEYLKKLAMDYDQVDVSGTILDQLFEDEKDD